MSKIVKIKEQCENCETPFIVGYDEEKTDLEFSFCPFCAHVIEVDDD